MFDAEQGLRRRCVLAPFLFNAYYTAVLGVAEKRFTAPMQPSLTARCKLQSQKKEKCEKKRGQGRTTEANTGRGGGGESPYVVGNIVR